MKNDCTPAGNINLSSVTVEHHLETQLYFFKRSFELAVALKTTILQAMFLQFNQSPIQENQYVILRVTARHPYIK